MVDSVSNAKLPNEISSTSRRTLSSPATRTSQGQITPVDAVDSAAHAKRDKKNNSAVYRKIDPQTGELVEQWPSELVQRLREHVSQLEGLFYDEEI